MNMTTLPKKAASLEYSLLRLPATLIETQLVVRFLADDSALRLSFERALGSVDEKAGRLLGDQALTVRGTALRRRTEVLAEAAELEEKAAQRKAEADAGLAREKTRVAAERKQAETTRREGVQKAAAAEQDAKRKVAAAAKAKETAEKRRIADEARARVEAATAKAKEAEARIDAVEKAVTAAPKEQLSQAVQEKATADAQRAKAETLAGLAEAEKDSRQS